MILFIFQKRIEQIRALPISSIALQKLTPTSMLVRKMYSNKSQDILTKDNLASLLVDLVQFLAAPDRTNRLP